MKKLAIVASVMMLGASIAMASSLTVPFFRDTGNNLSGGVPTSGFAGFIGIKNNTTEDITVQVVYTANLSGVFTDSTPATFILAANAAIAWRPVANDTAGEGAGAAVPNMVIGTAQAGSAKLTWADGTATDVQGRYVEIGPNGQSAFSYLLPPGT